MNRIGDCSSESHSVLELPSDSVCVAPNESHSSILRSYRPRGSLARALYEKQIADEYLSTIDKSQWYKCDLTQFPKDVAEKFILFDADEDTLNFLQQAEEKSEWIFTQIWHSLAKAFLGWFMTQTSINGWLRRGSMFVLSSAQFLRLMEKSNTWHGGTLLDLGAGDGEVTAKLSPAFSKVFVTEVSRTMQALLSKRRFELLDINEWPSTTKYDVISCLNLLDRCDKPLLLLQQMKEALQPGGVILIAAVIPFFPYVEAGSADHKPKELLPVQGIDFEEQVNSWIQDVFVPAKFEIIAWSRVPYLSEGDLRQSYYWLDDAIFFT